MRRSGGAKDAAAGVEQRRSALRLLALAVLTAVACLLALCVLQLRAAQHCHGGGAAARQDLRQGPGSAVPAQLMQQHQAAGSVQQQPLLQDLQPLPPPTNVSAEAAAGCLRPPYRFPRLIHQTVRNKTRLSCQQRSVIASWTRLNPGYQHVLWDDADMRDFMARFYPELLPTPYDEFLNAAERTDLWRVLVLHQLGGVYADMDVQCLAAIDAWNAGHGHDAALLLGVENFDASRPEPLHVANWVLAGCPGHPLLGRLPGLVLKAAAHQFLSLAPSQGVLTRTVYEAGILDRTGPAALTRAVYAHFEAANASLRGVTHDHVASAAGVAAGGARLLPIVAFASGWQVAEARAAARQQGAPPNVTCDTLVAPGALVCHMFWGSWRSSWGFGERHTYGDC